MPQIMSVAVMENRTQPIQVIELPMLDKRKYFPLTVLSGITIRSLLYPFTLIKTRIQIQRGKELYNGTFDAFRKIIKTDGPGGLYRGFLVNNLQVVAQLGYISTYEGVRHGLTYTPINNQKMRALFAGFCASMVGQTFVVPVDIISQHLMMKSKGKTNLVLKNLESLHIPEKYCKTRLGLAKGVIMTLYKQQGLPGFYKGYLASLSVYAPNSALWWFFYDTYCDIVSGVSPIWVPRLAIQCISGPLSGVSAAVITNPLDIVRARIQIQGKPFYETALELWKEERFGIFMKGLSARIIQSITFSFFIILGYESIKRVSLREEYKNSVRW